MKAVAHHKAVIFDLGKVLIDFEFQRAYQAMEDLCGCRAPEMVRRFGASRLAERFESGRIGPREFFDELSALIGLNVPYDHFCRMFNSIFTRQLMPESLLQGLAGRYRLILLSNTNAIHYEMLDRELALLRHFHHRVLSFEVQAIKPQPEIYHAALEFAGCRPEECFYTDDVPEFVEAAKLLGIDAVQFESVAGLETALATRGICWSS